MQDNVSPEYCSVCRKPVQGGFQVLDSVSADGEMCTIAIVETPGRDFKVCDLCNDAVHFRCSKYPETGYCDRCYNKFAFKPPARAGHVKN